jgi:hypothetical protein
MTDELNKAKELLLNKTFTQKGTKFQNKVELVSFKDIENSEILVTYKTLNNNSHTTPTMELNQFLGSHFI